MNELIINTTFVVHNSIENEFLEWLKNVYLKSAEASGAFASHCVARVLTRIEPDTESIAVQFRTTHKERAEQWHDDTAALLRDDLHSRFADRLMFFSTPMEVIDL